MGKSQPQYVIEATRRCVTHRPGTRLIYTGPRSGICRGWRCLGRVIRQEWEDHGGAGGPGTMLTELQRARVAAGLSQAQAAQIIGKSQSVYSKIERGRVKLTAADAKALCDKFALSLADLVTT